jgi:Fe-S oxidoreductase
MKCKAAWKCEACGFCLDCFNGSMCPITKTLHESPRKRKITHRVNPKTRAENLARKTSRAARNLTRLYPEHQTAFALNTSEPETIFDQSNLPVGQTKIKEVI